MKIAVINDTHAGCRNSSEVWIEYQRRFYEKVFFPYLIQHGITEILHLGDYFENRKNLNVHALRANREHFINRLIELDIHMTIIPGNHDVYYRSTNNLNSLSEILGQYPNHIRIVQAPTTVEYGTLTVGLVPWINPENYATTAQFLQECKTSTWIAGHFELAGFDMMRGVKSKSETFDRKLLKNFEQVLSGHYHTKSSVGNITYLGSQFEFTWADVHDPKYFHVIDSESREIASVQNPYTLFEKIVYDDSDQKKLTKLLKPYKNEESLSGKYVKILGTHVSNRRKFSEFVDSLYAMESILEVSVDEAYLNIQLDSLRADSVVLGDDEDAISGSEKDADNTPNLIQAYILGTDLDENVDRDRLSHMMLSFYQEVAVTTTTFNPD